MTQTNSETPKAYPDRVFALLRKHHRIEASTLTPSNREDIETYEKDGTTAIECASEIAHDIKCAAERGEPTPAAVWTAVSFELPADSFLEELRIIRARDYAITEEPEIWQDALIAHLAYDGLSARDVAMVLDKADKAVTKALETMALETAA